MSAQTQGSTADDRVPLSRERVLHAALELADQHGIESLSMRRLAQRLGVEAMSLYHHVRNKQDLLGGMLDSVYAEVEPPSGADWRSAMRRSAISFHHALLRHPWACGLLGSSIGPSPMRLRHMDQVLGTLRAAGFTAEMTHHAYHALDSHIVGFTLWLLPYLAAFRQEPDLPGTFLEQLDVDALPHLAEHVEVHMRPHAADEIDEFEFGLELILDGLERLRPAG
jgi:AcrR family transcriptional regulator